MRKAPVIGSGFAWSSYYGEGVFYDYNNRANHAFLIDDFEDGKPDHDLLAYDTYPFDKKWDENSPDEEFVKKLAKSYRVWSAHQIFLTPINTNINHSLISKLKSMFNKISRDSHGGLWFIKDGKKQKIENWLHFAGAVVDEIGVKNNNISDEKLSKLVDNKFFGKQKVFIQ